MKCDLLVKGRYILPMDEELSIINNGALAITGNKITDIGKVSDLETKYKASEILDAGNSIIMPGFINTHTHAAMTYFRGLADDLELKEWLENHIWPAEKKYVNTEFVKKASELACLEMLKSGVTYFNDMYFFQDVTARVAKQAGIRASIGEAIIDFPTPSCKNPDEALAKTKETIEEYKNDELINVILNPHSIYTLSLEYLTKACDLAKKQNLCLHIHVSETKQEVADSKKENKKTPVAFLNDINFLSNNVVAAHSVWLSDNDLTMYSNENVKVSHCPSSNMKLASGIAPVSEMLKRRIVVGLGTDGAASNNTLDMFSEMKVCALLHKINTLDSTVIDARQVVKMATIDGARVLGLEDKIGSLEVGKKADIITINLDKPHLTPAYDPYSHLVYCVNSGDVANVIINGIIIMKDRFVNTIDEEKVLSEAKSFKIN